MRKIIATLLFITVLAGVILFSLQAEWYRKNPRRKLQSNVTEKLSASGDSAIATSDVPVAAVLLYYDSIIGSGYNTVKKNLLAGGHAEINAISDAMRRTGPDSFMKLDRTHLTLITTWEPCAMCRGAIIEYDIRHIVVMHPKPLTARFREWMRSERFEWNKQGTDIDTLQECLFKKHPLYKQQKQE